MKKSWLSYSVLMWIWVLLAPTAFSYTQETIDAYLWAFQNWITTQSSIKKANVEWEVTRQAMAKMIVNFSKNILGTAQVKQNGTNTCKFSDEKKITQDLRDSVKEACELWLMGQWVKKFDPKGTLSRAQFWTILSRALWWDTYDWGTPYYEKHLQALQEAWIMNNINNPHAKELRWNVMIMLMRGENLIKDFSKWDAQKNAAVKQTWLIPGSWVVWNQTNWTLTISYKKRSITMKDKNLWAKEVWIGENSIWHLFVWWRNQWFYFDDSKNETWFLVMTEWTWKEWAKWPCPKWYHIPTKAEWQTVIDLWKNNNPKVKGDWMGKKFSEDLFLPPVGTRQEAEWRAEWKKELWAAHQAYYWVSTPNRNGTWANASSKHLYLSFDTKPIFWGTWEPEIWPVIANWNLETVIRCFEGDPTAVTTKSSSSSSSSSTLTPALPKIEDPAMPKFMFYF